MKIKLYKKTLKENWQNNWLNKIKFWKIKRKKMHIIKELE